MHDPHFRIDWFCSRDASAITGSPVRGTARLVPAPLRVAHGFSALALVMIFLALHIANHLLMFPAGEGTYDAVMKVLRHVYRTDILQPLVVALFLFQIGTGLYFVWRLTAAPSDRFRTFQIASGAKASATSTLATATTLHPPPPPPQPLHPPPPQPPPHPPLAS